MVLFKRLIPRITWSLQKNRKYYTIPRKELPKDEQYLTRLLTQRIKATGPLTIAEYMKEVLTNPLGGYYMNHDVFGDKGDFITSPEISQMFGEMIAVWFLNEWEKLGAPKPLQIVELGPGRGTLSNDILKVFKHFKRLQDVQLALVEVSPFMTDMQSRKLCVHSSPIQEKDSLIQREGVSFDGNLVKWYKHLNDVPKCFSLILAHEFFDALPIHKFQKVQMDFREVLVDINTDGNDPPFRYVVAREETPMQKILLDKDDSRKHIEISPESMKIYHELCQRIREYGGISLICDYGHNGKDVDTFRAFKKHEQVNPLLLPGSADLTADVDFRVINKIATEEEVLSFGPVTQQDFLLNVGLEHRFNSLIKIMDDKANIEELRSCYNMLIHEDKMGIRFKFLSIFPDTVKGLLEKFPVVGFS